ncbi:MAG: hypothetical protein WCE61_04070 [Candidatus Acidiferrum sp.]
MKMNLKTVAAIAAILLIVVFVTGLRLMSSFRKPAPSPHATNPLSPFGQPGSALPDMTMIAGDQAAVFKLMTQYGLDIRTATYLAQAKARVLSQTNTSVHFVLTLPEGFTSDETITITPDVKYMPTPAELEASTKSGANTYNVKFTAENESDTKAHMTLQYFVPYRAVPAELQRRIHGESSSVHWFELVPSVWAQEGGGEGSGMSVYQEAGLEAAKEVLNDQAKEGKLSKEFPKPLAGLLDVLNAFKKEQEHVGWLDELDELQDCAENPTNPLTKKAFDQDPAYRDQVVHGVTQARGDVTGFTAMRFLNLGVSAATALSEAPLGPITGPISSWTDETLKQLAEQRITDAQKNVTHCHHENMLSGQFRPMVATLKFAYNRHDPETGNEFNGWNSGDEKRGFEGTVHMVPDSTGFLVGKGTAELVIQRDQHGRQDNGSAGEAHGETHTTSKGVGQIEIRAGGATPLSGVVHAEFHTEALKTDSEAKVGNLPPTHSHTENGIFGMDCDFDNVNFVHGGTYKTFVGGDAHGTCTIDLSPE